MGTRKLSSLIALAVSAAMTLAVPGVASAAPASPTGNENTDISQLAGRVSQLSGRVSPSIKNNSQKVNVFIETKGTAGVVQKSQTLDSLNRQRSGASEQQKQNEANNDGNNSAKNARDTANSVFGKLQTISNHQAEKAYTTSYATTGLVVSASGNDLHKLAKESSDVVRIVPLRLHTPLGDSTGDSTADSADTQNAKSDKDQTPSQAAEGKDKSADTNQAAPSQSTEGKQKPADKSQAAPSKAPAPSAAGKEKPANKNSDQLVDAVKTWNQTGKTGKGVNVAVVDTGLDYTHADFGGSGNPADYETALASTKADPMTDPTLKPMFDPAKFKGGYDFAGTNYPGVDANGDPDYSRGDPDQNPIDGKGGHHGTHVAGTVAGYGVTNANQKFSGDYKTLTNADVAGMKIGPGAAPEAGLYSLKVFGDNGGSTDLVLEALDWVSQHNLKPDVAAKDKISIVSMSLGGSFGSVYDPENEAVDNLAKDGVLSVIAAGNDGDVTDILGAPGSARTALTVAASQSGKSLVDAITVTGGSAAFNGKTLGGQYSSDFADIDHFDVSGEVVRVKDPGNLDGCKAYSDADKTAVNGKIAYVRWDDSDVACGSGTRFNNAEAAGAKAIVFDSQKNTFTAGIAGNADIPGFQIDKKDSDDANIEQAIDEGHFTIRLSSSLRLSMDSQDPSLADTLADFSSRGLHGSYDGTVKPDVAAPGVGILSASAGTGTGMEKMSGTSMATPLTAGVTALARQAHPDWDVATLKAQMVNTASHDVGTPDASRLPYGPLRDGTGRIDALAAVNNTVQATADGEQAITAQFGIVQVPKEGYSAKKTITVTNNGDTDRTYSTSYKARTSTPGVSYTLSASSVTVPAHGTASFDVTLSIPDQSALRHTRDATQNGTVGGQPVSYISDATGVVELTPQGSGDASAVPLRVAVVAAPKPISATKVGYDIASDGARTLNVTGNGINQGSDEYAYQSKVIPMVLAARSGKDASGVDDDPSETDVRDLQSFDIRAVGYSTTAPQSEDKSQSMLNFGIVTDKTWNRLDGTNDIGVYIDTNADGKPDYMTDMMSKNGSTQWDTVMAVTQDLQTGDVVDLEPIDDAFISDSNQVVLSVKLSALGIASSASTAPISFGVESASAHAVNDDSTVDQVGIKETDGTPVPTLKFDAFAPAVWFGHSGATGSQSEFADRDGTSIPVHKSAAPTRDADGTELLMLHTEGAVPDTAEQGDAVVDTLWAGPVDKTELSKAVEKAKTLKQSDYTEDSWAAFATALTNAEAMLNDSSATPSTVSQALDALNAAEQALVRKSTEPGKPDKPVPGQSGTGASGSAATSGKPTGLKALGYTGVAVSGIVFVAIALAFAAVSLERHVRAKQWETAL